MSDGSSRKQNIAVLIGAMGIIVISVLVTLYFSSSLTISFGDRGRSKGFQNVTFTDAVLTCEAAVKDLFGKRLENYVLDDHSSRYENREFVYKIFYEANVNASSEKQALHYVNCFVRASNGKIAKFESFEEAEGDKPALNQDTNMFGWPR